MEDTILLDQEKGQEMTSKWELEIDDLLAELERQLGGYVYEVDSQGNIIVNRDTSLALMNDVGIRFIKSRISLIANKFTLLSNLNEEEIKKICFNYSMAIKNELIKNYKKFEIKKETLETLILSISILIYTTLKRAMNEGERKYRKLIEKREIRLIPGLESDAKKGLFSRLLK
jgi:hypothetical protein